MEITELEEEGTGEFPKREFPKRIVIFLENEEEARGLYAIFNKTTNTRVFPKAAEIREKIGRQFYVTDGEIVEGVDYDEFYPQK